MIACRRCSECEGRTHHWMADPHDPDNADDEDRELPGDFGCKHCEQRGDECGDCEGAYPLEIDEEAALCLTCGGEGVVPIAS
jgi:hypothetical protein